VKRLILCIFLAIPAVTAEPRVIPLWPGVAPGSENANYPEQDVLGPQDTVRHLYNITHPEMLAYFPEAAKANGTAVVVCPGGGFRFLAFDYEGTDVALWLNAHGVAAFVLKYRLARTGDAGEKDRATMQERYKSAIPQAVADGQQAIRVVRAHASEWGIAPDRIGIMGFSAGGWVTAAVALQHDSQSRPNFAAPIYAAVPPDVTVPADAPPLFLAHADDDTTVSTVDNSIRLYTAWKKARIPAELHIYLRGGHGFGMRKKELPTDGWIDRFADWLELEGMLKPAR